MSAQLKTVIDRFYANSAWLPLLNPNAAGSEINRQSPDDRQARKTVIQGVLTFYRG